MDMADRPGMAAPFAAEGLDCVIRLAAQTGVSHSIKNTCALMESNRFGFVNIPEGCRHGREAHLSYGSSSTVYGGNAQMPFSEHQAVDHPVSLYAATKKAKVLMAHACNSLCGLPATGLYFFTV